MRPTLDFPAFWNAYGDPRVPRDLARKIWLASRMTGYGWELGQVCSQCGKADTPRTCVKPRLCRRCYQRRRYEKRKVDP